MLQQWDSEMLHLHDRWIAKLKTYADQNAQVPADLKSYSKFKDTTDETRYDSWSHSETATIGKLIETLSSERNAFLQQAAVSRK